MYLYGDFPPKEFANALQLLKFGKAFGLKSLCSKLIFHVGLL